jgi:hypothetical protein
VWWKLETAIGRRGLLASLKPKIALPQHLRRLFLKMTPLNIAVWTLAGFYLYSSLHWFRLSRLTKRRSSADWLSAA